MHIDNPVIITGACGSSVDARCQCGAVNEPLTRINGEWLCSYCIAGNVSTAPVPNRVLRALATPCGRGGTETRKAMP